MAGNQTVVCQGWVLDELLVCVLSLLARARFCCCHPWAAERRDSQ